MLYRVHNGAMEEYPDGSLVVKEGSSLEAEGVFTTKAEAKAFKVKEISAQIKNQQIYLSNLEKHLEAASKLEE